MSNLWHDIKPQRVHSDDFIVVIEIEQGTRSKYELDKESGAMILDRILYTSTHYPANYGFIPRTYAKDGDPLDVLLVCSETIRPLTLVRCYPIGVIIMKDGGKLDEKIIAVPFTDPMYNSYTDIAELPSHLYEMMVHFFSVYKNLENTKGVEVEGVYGPDRAKEIINECIDHYIESFCR